MRFVCSLLICSIIFSSCSRNSTINRVVDPYYDKAAFNPNWQQGLLSPEWYYRMTVVDTDPTSKVMSIGDGHWLHPETIRFEITENFLMGWKAGASVPGTELDKNSNYKGSPVVVFKILSHFDVTRNYDPVTASSGNLIIENKTDKSWYKRRFMKIDFSKNLAQRMMRPSEEDEPQEESIDNAYAVGQNNPANPKRSRFENGYFEVTTRQGVKVDLMKFYGLYGEPFQMDASAPVVDLRFSFLRKPQKANYQPLNYSENMFDKFGFYRVIQQNWDPIRGVQESKKNKNITRFNIWNEDGSPKPIVYYTSVSHPRNLIRASRKVESEWNQIFKELVFEIKKDQYKNINQVPDMWVLRENDCNWDAVNQKLVGSQKKQVEEAAGVSLSEIKSRLDHANDLTNNNSFTQNTQEEAKALDDLEKICAAFEYATQGTKSEFKYQRSGDLRYNLLNIINKYAATNWSGLGPMFADQETGEIIQSQANVNLWYLDKRAQAVVDLIDTMSGKIRFKELVLGVDVRNYMRKKLQQIHLEEKISPDFDALSQMQNRLNGQSLDKISEEEIQSRLNIIDSNLFLPKIGEDNLDLIKHMKNRQERLEKQSLGVSDPPEFLDNLIVGMALQYKNEDAKTRFLKIRESVYAAVALHEIGHNHGLTHNMSGSADPLNYGERFWKIQKLPAKIFDAITATQEDPELQKALIDCYDDSKKVLRSEATAQDCFRQQELMYSSIMDYHASWNADLGGLGAYDKAAIFFGYGQLIQVFPENNLSQESKQKGLSRWIFLNDWRKIPTKLVETHEKINERSWVSYDPNKKLANEVPYRFCADPTGKGGPHCRAFDFGADMRGRAARNKVQYWNHYFLTHFSRDRIWNFHTDFQNIISQDLGIFEDFNQIMNWYGYYMLTDPDFKNSDAAKDYLAATVSGLNHYSHVLGHPVSGKHLTTLENDSLLQPIDELDECVVENIIVENDQKERAAIPGHVYSEVFLGDGRPFVVGLNNDYEDYHMTYVGSFHTKLLAGFYLSYPGSFFPRVDNLKDPRLFRMNWYRLFPEEVGDLFSKLIRSEWSQLGPVVSPEGELLHRDILDLKTLKKPNYDGFTPVMPANASMLPYRALYYAVALLSGSQNTEFNLINSMQIGIEGAFDDRRPVLSNPEGTEIFDSLTGHRYWAKSAGKSPIAYQYIQKLKEIKTKKDKLASCFTSNEIRLKENSCSCLKIKHGDNCCSPSNPECPKVVSMPCSDQDLKLKLEQTEVELENATGFADDMRRLVQRYTSLK